MDKYTGPNPKYDYKQDYYATNHWHIRYGQARLRITKGEKLRPETLKKYGLEEFEHLWKIQATAMAVTNSCAALASGLGN
jgi:hypothetical protein